MVQQHSCCSSASSKCGPVFCTQCLIHVLSLHNHCTGARKCVVQQESCFSNAGSRCELTFCKQCLRWRGWHAFVASTGGPPQEQCCACLSAETAQQHVPLWPDPTDAALPASTAGVSDTGLDSHNKEHNMLRDIDWASLLWYRLCKSLWKSSDLIQLEVHCLQEHHTDWKSMQALTMDQRS